MFNVPELSLGDIQSAVETVIGKHHPTRSLPIPIEEIVEFNLGINIVSVENLHKKFGVDAFTSGDGKDIFVEDSLYSDLNHLRRYRFTLAHELGHIDLHGGFYKDKTFYGPDDWSKHLAEIDAAEHQLFEAQADRFGGMLLVPRKQLEVEIDLLTSGSGLSGDPFAKSQQQMCELANRFQVSESCMYVRITQEKLGAP